MGELFRIETDRCRLVWSTRGAEPAFLTGSDRVPGRLSVLPGRASPLGDVRLRLGGPGGEEIAAGEPADLRLFEQTEYTLFLQSAGGASVTLDHRDPVLLRNLAASEDRRIVHGRINFGAQVGRSTFAVRAGGELDFEFEAEVFPTKLDYARDYTRLVSDTEEILTGLVLEYLRPTSQPGRGIRAAHPAHLEWLMLLRHGMDELERATDHIARRPEWGLAREAQQSRAERTRRPDAALRRAVLRGAGAGQMVPLAGGIAVRERLPERRSRPTLDTPEHRWLAAQLGRIRRRLACLRQEEAARAPGGRRERTLGEIGSLETRLARLARTEPLAAASGDPPPGFASLQLLSAPGYREAYAACLLLSLALHLDGGPVRLGVKDLHLLYEQWCFLTLVRIAAEATGQPVPVRELLAPGQHGLRVLLNRGQGSTVRFDDAEGRRLSLTYNPRFAGDPLLVPQRPDILLELRGPGGGPSVRLVLDAKYRLDASPEYLRRYGSPGPPEDALNSLHRYRDAIIKPGRAGEEGAAERVVAQAVALFPWREPEAGTFAATRLWRSVGRIGVGAIPLLPGSTAYLEEWLRGALASAG